MQSISVLAADTSQAMDEVVRRLGPDAYILATSQKGGQVEIRATKDPVLPDKRRKPDKVANFDELFAKRMVGETGPKFRSCRGRPAPAGRNQTDSETAPLPTKGSDDHPGFAALQATLRLLVKQLEEKLADNVALPSANVFSLTSRKLLAAGFSANLINLLGAGFDENLSQNGTVGFVDAVASRVAMENPMQALAARRIAIIGPAGGGRTILAAKIAAHLLAQGTENRPFLIGVNDGPFGGDGKLRTLAKILDLQVDTATAKLGLPYISASSGTEIFDLPSRPEVAVRLLQDLQRETRADDLQVILALPAGASSHMISQLHSIYAKFDPVVVLTRLDECDLTPREISMLAETGLQLGWLTGANNLIEPLVPAKKETLKAYISQRLEQVGHLNGAA